MHGQVGCNFEQYTIACAHKQKSKGLDMRLVAPTLALVLLAACQPEKPDQAPDMSASCGAQDLQALTGQPLAQFQGHPDAEAIRVIAPGMAVTMDFRPDRLNVEHDDDLVITRIYCG